MLYIDLTTMPLSIEKWIKDPGFTKSYLRVRFGDYASHVSVYKYYFAMFAFMAAINIFEYITTRYYNVILFKDLDQKTS